MNLPHSSSRQTAQKSIIKISISHTPWEDTLPPPHTNPYTHAYTIYSSTKHSFNWMEDPGAAQDTLPWENNSSKCHQHQEFISRLDGTPLLQLSILKENNSTECHQHQELISRLNGTPLLQQSISKKDYCTKCHQHQEWINRLDSIPLLQLSISKETISHSWDKFLTGQWHLWK